MDAATIFGLIGTFSLIIYAMSSNLGSFMDVNAMCITIGGTFGATFVAFPIAEIVGLVNVLKNTVLVKRQSSTEVIDTLVSFSTKARRDGILALETAIQEVDNIFMTRGIQLAVDGQEPDAIETILSTEIDSMRSRHAKGADILATMGGIAPAMGMIGTLVGLVLMLQQMDDPKNIGPAMAIALLTTFYGAVMANVIFNPLANKLRLRSREEISNMELVREGILAIAAGDNPRIVEQRLHAYLQPRFRKSSFD